MRWVHLIGLRVGRSEQLMGASPHATCPLAILGETFPLSLAVADVGMDIVLRFKVVGKNAPSVVHVPPMKLHGTTSQAPSD